MTYHSEKENLFYIPISSLNFNSLFSSESISPHIFYLKRSYGYRRNIKNQFQPLENALLLYSQPFQFSLSASEFEEYPMFIGVPFDIIKPKIKKTIEVEAVQVAIVGSTIYFDSSRFVFIFPNEEAKQAILSKSLSSFETKVVDKYNTQFKLLIDFPIQPIHITLPEIRYETDYNPELLIDELFDSNKGLFYGLLLGYIFHKPKKLIEIERQISQIQNDYGSFKSDIELKIDQNDSYSIKGFNKTKLQPTNFANEKYSILLERIKTLIDNIIEVFGSVNQQNLINDYVRSLKLDPEVLGSFYEIEGLKTLLFENALKLYPIPEYLAKGLVEIIQSYYFNRSNKINKEKIDNEFKDNLEILKNTLQEAFSSTIDDQKIEIIRGFGRQLKLFDFTNPFVTENLSNSDIMLFQSICEILINNRKRHRGETNIEVRNELLTYVGEKVNKEFGVTSKERNYLVEFFKLQNNQSHNFRLYNTDFHSLKAFVAFLINIDSAERLEEYLADNNLIPRFIPLVFFGAYTGFSGLGRTLTDKVFNSRNKRLFRVIDSELLYRPLDSNIEKKDYELEIIKNEQRSHFNKSDIIAERKSKSTKIKVASNKNKVQKSDNQATQTKLDIE